MTKSFSSDQVAKILQMWTDGKPLNDISIIVGADCRTIRQKINLPPRPTLPRSGKAYKYTRKK